MAPPHRPPRRLPARVYWFRRAMVLGLAAALVVGVAQLLGVSSDGPAAEVSAAPVGSGTTSGPPAATADARPDRDRRPTGRAGRKPKRERTRTPLAEPSGPCRDEDVVVTPEIVGEAHAGAPVTIRLAVTTLETPACTWRVSADTVAVKLVSGADRIWSSQECPRALPDVEVVARETIPGAVELQWHGQRSDSECSRTTPWALPGWYRVQAAAFGAEPTDVQFELLPAVAATVTATPKPEKGARRGAGSGEG